MARPNRFRQDLLAGEESEESIVLPDQCRLDRCRSDL